MLIKKKAMNETKIMEKNPIEQDRIAKVMKLVILKLIVVEVK